MNRGQDSKSEFIILINTLCGSIKHLKKLGNDAKYEVEISYLKTVS